MVGVVGVVCIYISSTYGKIISWILPTTPSSPCWEGWLPAGRRNRGEGRQTEGQRLVGRGRGPEGRRLTEGSLKVNFFTMHRLRF